MDIHFYHHIGAETLEFLQKTGVPAITNRLDNIQEILKIMNAKQDEFDAQLAEIKAGQQEGTDLVVNLGTIVTTESAQIREIITRLETIIEETTVETSGLEEVKADIARHNENLAAVGAAIAGIYTPTERDVAA